MQHRRWIGRVNLSATVASMALAILLIVMASQPVEGQTFSTLHSFSGLDGGTPTAGPTMDGAGNLYGTTQYGGAAGYGSVFKLVHTGGSWILHPLYMWCVKRLLTSRPDRLMGGFWLSAVCGRCQLYWWIQGARWRSRSAEFW